VLELRTGVEVEAAGLAARRANAAQVKRIGEKFDAIGRAVARGEDAVDEDFAFHSAIADATGNPQFRRFLDYLGRVIIPRGSLWNTADQDASRARLGLFQREHETIVQAIAQHSPEDARAAMQRHLVNSIGRYEKLAAERSKAG
jgi:DNA-binding FadR family transcriptional regulator